MKRVLVKWLLPEEGGRRSEPPQGLYYPVSKFPCDPQRGGSWSVVLDLEQYKIFNGKKVSYGFVRFLVDGAPKELLDEFSKFEIYEGARKVADVDVISE